METSRELLVFALQLALPLAVSLAVTRILLPTLQPLLEELCGGAARARFWVVFTGLVFVTLPLLTVLLAPLPAGEMDALLRTLLIRTLSGSLLALGGTGWVIWLSIRRRPEQVS